MTSWQLSSARCNPFLLAKWVAKCNWLFRVIQSYIYFYPRNCDYYLSTAKIVKHVKGDERKMFVTISWKSWLSHCGSLCVLPQGTSHWVLACSCKVCDQPHTIHARTPFSIKAGSCQPSAGQHHRLNGEAFESHRCKADQNSHTQMMPPAFFIVFSCSCFTSISTLKSTMQKDLLKLRHPQKILSKDHELASGPPISGSFVPNLHWFSHLQNHHDASSKLDLHKTLTLEAGVWAENSWISCIQSWCPIFFKYPIKTTHPFLRCAFRGKSLGRELQTPRSRSMKKKGKKNDLNNLIHLHGLTWSSSRLIFRGVTV